MNVVFYSTNSNHFDGERYAIQTLPSRAAVWDSFAAAHPADTFFVVTQLPASFVADIAGNTLAQTAARVQYIVTQKETAADIASDILALKPDLAIAATFWVTPFDWLPMQDAMVADALRERGVETLCNPSSVAFDCFDKWRTHLFLERHGFAVPKALYVSYQQFWCERSHREVKTNVYKEYVLRALQKMHYPVVIKDTVGLSSYGMEVATTYKQALFYLFSGRTNSDRIIEEYLVGDQFGAEIYGKDDNYTVLPPCLFSLNRYGITSPKQSVKLGPVTNEAYAVATLNETLLRLARELHICGVAQVDVAFSGGIWYIIEINPRLSGMSETYAAALGTSVPELLYAAARAQPIVADNMRFVCNFKLPLLTAEQMRELSQQDEVLYVHQIHNTAAKQEREKGYCEIVLGGTKTLPALTAALESIAARFSHLIEPIFLQNARTLAEKVATSQTAPNLL